MHLKVLENNEHISIYGDVLFQINHDSLTQLYSPIIGIEANYLYNYLWSIKRIVLTSKLNPCNNINELKNSLNWNLQKIFSNLNKLSAVGLIQLFSSGSNLIIKLIQPLHYCEFINNPKLKQLLINKIGRNNYENLQYYYNYEVIPSDYLLLESSIDSLNETNLFIEKNNVYLDWNKISSKLIVMFNKKIRIDNTCKEIIGENYSINLLNENNLYDVIYKSSICKNDLCDVDLELLLNSIEIIKQDNQIKNDATLHRSYNVFDINKDLKECHEIIADYKKFNPYNYLLLLTKSNITPNVAHMIDSIKKTFNLSDAFINVVCDYSIYKNSGRIEPNYIYKLCSTINNLGIDNIENVILYLRYVSAHIKIPTSLFNSTSSYNDIDNSKIDKNYISFDEIITNNLGKNNE